ncbi:MAG: hypothetical protein ABSG42_09600 [Nitrospirota bacterium]
MRFYKGIAGIVFLFVLFIGALPGYCETGTVLWQDQATGQLYTKPADGRVPVNPVKDLNLPPAAVNSLYEDQNGVVYMKPGEGRTPIAMAAPASPESSPAPSDYSSQAFYDAVKHVVGEQNANTYPRVKVGATFFGEYYYDLEKQVLSSDKSTGGWDRNAFTINRGYINVLGDLTPEVSFRITPDVTRISTTAYVTSVTTTKNAAGAVTAVTTTTSSAPNAGDWELRLKYAYVDFHNFLGIYPSLGIRMGQLTAWLDYEETLWQYRVIDKMLSDVEGFLSAGDLGVSTRGKIPGNFGDWQADVINGKDYHTDATNKYKSVEARVTLTPLPFSPFTKGLNLTGFANVGRSTRQTEQDRYIAWASYKYEDDLFLGGEYLWTLGSDSYVSSAVVPATQRNIWGSGYSLLAWYRMPFLKPLRILGRYDNFNHDEDPIAATTVSTATLRNAENSDIITRYIYGVSYDVNKYVMFVLDNERTETKLGSFLNPITGSKPVPNQNLVKVDLQVVF